MSHIGKKPIDIPEGVEVKLEDGVLNFEGKKGELSQAVLPFVKIEIKDRKLTVQPTARRKQARANWGTMAALIKNAVEGVSDGFNKSLTIEGVGYRAGFEGENLILNVGFSHPVKYKPPAGISVSVDKNMIKVEGASKHLVGETAAGIRRIKKPEPYKGTGIRYTNEVIRRKAGKKAATTAS